MALFQSLFSWMLLTGTDASGPRAPMFQSLLSWMLLSGILAPTARNGGALFQSLLSWMLLIGSPDADVHGLRRPCFNPCSRGCCSVARKPAISVA